MPEPTPLRSPAATLTFQVASGVGPEDLRALREGFARASLMLQTLVASDPPRPVTVEVVAAGGSKGCCDADRSTPQRGFLYVDVTSPAWLSASWGRRQKIAAHEYVHTWQAAKGCWTTDRVPPWFSEGMAEYVALEAAIRDGLLDREFQQSLDASAANLATSLRSWESWGPQQPEGLYALFHLGVKRLVQQSSGISLRSFCESVAADLAWPEAFQLAFGRSVDSFYAEVDAGRPVPERATPAALPPGLAVDPVTLCPLTLGEGTFTIEFRTLLAHGPYPQTPRDRVPYAFCVRGFDLRRLTAEQARGLVRSPQGAGWSLAGGTFVLLLPLTAAQERYDVVLELPDGRRAETTFVHGAPAEPSPSGLDHLNIVFVRQVPRESVPWGAVPSRLRSQSDRLLAYAFRVSNAPSPLFAGYFVEVWPYQAAVRDRRCDPCGAWGWLLVNQPEHNLLFLLESSWPEGNYELVVKLLDGRMVVAPFPHVAR